MHYPYLLCTDGQRHWVVGATHTGDFVTGDRAARVGFATMPDMDDWCKRHCPHRAYSSVREHESNADATRWEVEVGLLDA